MSEGPHPRVPESGQDLERRATAAGVTIGPGVNVTERAVTLAIWGQIIVSTIGQVLSLASFLLGSILIAMGLTGNTHWTTEVLGSKVEVTDTYPGVGLVVAGIIALLATRYSVKFKGNK